MAAGVAERMWRETGRRVAIVDGAGRPRTESVWDRNPAIDPSSSLTLRDHPGHRGYMLRWDDGPRAVFDPSYRNMDHPGRIYPIPVDAPRESFIVIEPNVFRPSSINKDWGFDRWQIVADMLIDEGYEVVQCVPDFGRPLLAGAKHVRTPTFWHAANVIDRAALVLSPEGGTHHMAGALRRPAVVIFGGFTHPDTTGYDWHTNLYVDGPDSPCGRYDACPHCRDALASITPDMVVDAAKNI